MIRLVGIVTIAFEVILFFAALAFLDANVDVAVLQQQFHQLHGHQEFYSGVYYPRLDLGLEIYAGAWLMPTSHFLTRKADIDRIYALEMSTTALLDDRQIIMTRDYFDFQVEHYSSMTNSIPDRRIDAYLADITNARAYVFEKASHAYDSSFRNETIVILPYSVTGASSHSAAALREAFYRLTFWSIHRYFPTIIASVTSDKDYNSLMSLKLPLYEVYHTNIRGEGWKNPRQALLMTYEKFQSNSDFRTQFRYIYFSEGDLILHMRSANHLYNILNSNYGKLFITPHRMQSLPLAKAYAPSVRHYIEDWRREQLDNATLVIEKSLSPKGSCCDDGRFVFTTCHNWWYHCRHSGIKNITTWIKYGSNGFSVPVTSEHKGKCKYSSKRVLCPVPKDCAVRSPKSADERACGELPILQSDDPNYPSTSFP